MQTGQTRKIYEPETMSSGASDISVTTSPNDIVWPSACCCGWCGFWCKFPECIGVRGATTCLCISSQCACGCVPITVCCKDTCSCCGLDCRCAMQIGREHV